MVSILGGLTLVEGAAIATMLATATGVIAYALPRKTKTAKKSKPVSLNAPVMKITGRDDQIKAMIDHFTHSQHPVIISGPAAIGKTVLAEAYAEQASGYVGWALLRLTSDSEMATGLTPLAQSFDVSETDAKTLILKTFTVMAQSKKRWLVILDNADSDKEIARAKGLLKDHQNIDFIITSQREDWPDTEHEPIKLRKLESGDAVQLMIERSGHPESDKLKELAVETLECLPLPITLAAADLRVAGITPETYQVYFERMLDKTPSTGKYPKKLGAAIKLALERLDDGPRALLDLAAYMHPDDIDPGHFLRGAAGIEREGYDPLPEPLHSLCSDETDLRLALGECANHSLLVSAKWKEEDTWRLHRTTQAALRAAMDAEKQSEMIGLAARIGAAQMTNDPQYDTHLWPMWHRLAPHSLALFEFTDQAKDEDAKRMSYWLNQISIFLNLTRRDLELDLKLRERVVEINRTVYGEISKGYAISLGNLALIQNDLGSTKVEAEKIELYNRAEQNLKDCLDIETKIKTPPLEMSITINNLGNLYLARTKFEEARSWFQKARELRENHGADAHLIGINHSHFGLLFSEWANSLSVRSEIAANRRKAVKHYKLGLEFTQAGLGHIHPSTALRHFNLGIEQYRISETRMALRHLVDAVGILGLACRYGQIGEDHPDIALYEKSLEVVLEDLGKSHAEGEALIAEAMVELEAKHEAWKAEKAAEAAAAESDKDGEGDAG